MRLPLHWLYEYVRPELETAALVDRLDMTGTAVEHVVDHGVGGLEHFVVGKVLTAEQHPDADRLRVCTVDVGDGGEPKQIVCGAPNVAAGQTVAVARPGSVMPDGTRLKAAKLRGVVSDGMILAEDELGLGTDHAGIIELDGGLAAGTALIDVLPIATEVLELEITPNRPDCLGVYGVAREVHAITGATLADPPWASDPHPGGEGIDGVSVRVDCPDLCPRFTVRAFEDVAIGPSPLWLKGRLMAAGMRPISNVVDITNYVMLLTGQPMHAFDGDRVAGGELTIRRALEAETVNTLDGQTRTLTADMVVICDADGPTSIAGVMGGARSEVGPETTRVWMEAATWDGPNINRTSSALGLRSEASGRFEKGLSRQQALEAQALASALMIELCGARPVGGTIDVGGVDSSASAPIALRAERVEALLGAAVAAERQVEILTSLGFGVDARDGALHVAVPHWRARDVTREADLIEEVARVDGIERLPSTLPPRRRLHAARLSHGQRVRRRAEEVLADRGLLEVAGWSFTEPSVLDKLQLAPDDRHRAVVALVNPMSETQSILRTVQLPSLLDAAKHNLARGATDIGLFESAAVYRPGEGETPATEVHVLGALLVGAPAGASWRDGPSRPADAFAAKGMLAAVLDALRVDWSVAAWHSPEAGRSEAFLHPGRSGNVHIGDQRVGWVGEVHPLVMRAWEIDRVGAAFALDLGIVAQLAPETASYRDLTSFPALREDIAVVVGAAVPAGRVVEVARAAGGTLLAGAEVFDVFAGEDLTPPRPGTVSLALHLEFRAEDRTLSDDDVAPVRDRIVAKLAEELGGELRG